MDEAIGEILDLLDQYHIADNTLVIFFSDNGGSGGSADNHPLRGHKALLFEGGVRVPCMVRFPGKIPAGAVSNAFLSSLEILPTILMAADLSLPEDTILDGFDMMPILNGQIKSGRNEMFWQRQNDKAARVANWKWVESTRGSGLFNLDEDISESHDLSENRPEKLQEMKQHFARWRAEMDASEPRGPFRDY
jgi:arylsulfatase A-like enzyme